mgnify:CR=1 FL=1
MSVKNAPADYGKEVDILKEDFSKMTTGTQDKPDFDATLNDYEMHDNAWLNMLPDFTHTPTGARTTLTRQVEPSTSMLM